ncbi:hypothetical protein A2627_00095 [Candidatus Woesebacteria bacterium RIFCSPHIGHO2_01_FULL_39_28]|uniref:Uncharacterized protein n=1 Tax=Candidatus Woesebacteria bacterium RIFCSPHIGHO2_01_FULL_39_28 TaxID=1802496 RepID=A0A1F7YCW6_9BACT|nr:MAG: hypothetical protein A2627_00095 [Candidatus Woesebacteria bacterium RIFCSPHIGHO2_01_FULL_39_28]OGM57872.1 MAG: hypothetical protein A3A50_04525 [Candidatus Woesebacteria bacterium RIFCSPLOWO2_01_FULL_38_20]
MGKLLDILNKLVQNKIVNKKVLITVLSLGVLISLGVGLFIFLGPRPKKEEKKLINFEPEVTPIFQLKPEEIKAVSDPAKNAEAVKNLAQKAAVLDITACTPSIPILEVKQNESFTVKNSGPKDLSMVIHGEKNYIIPSKGEVKILANFTTGPGSYNYGCDAEDNTIGLILVIK